MENQDKELLNTEEVENETVEETTTELEVVETEENNEEVKEEEYVGKQVTTSIRYDYKTMKYFNMYNSAYRRKLPKLYLLFGLVTIILGAYFVVTALLAAKEDPETNITGTYFTIAIFGFFAFYFIKQSVTFESFVDKQISTYFAQHKVVKQKIQIREDKITLIPENKPEESFSYDWALVSSIEEINEFFFLYIGKQPLIISKDPNMMVEGSYDQMLEIFDEKIELKPYKKCTKQIVKQPITFVHQDDLENDENAVEVEATEENND